ncbi:MAG: alpha/beta fold hydrolase [Deltaproteobacteria bacterium]|nr:alpha/beta fold hydrolase [Deltaproteobacteria bacterium]
MENARFIDVNGVGTRYFDKGSGEVVVFFHGSHFGTMDACDSANDWDTNFDRLAEWFRVIAVDKLGQGHTDNPKRDEDYTPGAVVQHAYEFLMALGLQNVHVVGHSRGGYLVGRLTLEHPEIVRSCIIVDSGTLAPGPANTQLIMANAPNPRLTRESQRWVIEHYSHTYDHITDKFLDGAVEIANLPKYREAVKKMEDQGLKGKLFMPRLTLDKDETLNWILQGRLKTPTLVVWGKNDPTASLRRGQALYELIADSAPIAEMHVINKAGHFCYREQPETFNQVIRGFVEKVSLASRTA